MLCVFCSWLISETQLWLYDGENAQSHAHDKKCYIFQPLSIFFVPLELKLVLISAARPVHDPTARSRAWTQGSSPLLTDWCRAVPSKCTMAGNLARTASYQELLEGLSFVVCAAFIFRTLKTENWRYGPAPFTPYQKPSPEL